MSSPIRADDPPPCPNGDDYSPCVCYKGSIRGTENEMYHGVTCDRHPLAEIKETFSKTGPGEMGVINLSLQESDDFIPENMLAGGKEIVYIQIVAPKVENFKLKIHPEAFRSNANYTEAFYFSGMDMSRMDFEFLQGFDLVDFIKIFSATNIHKARWSTLPLLAKLTRIELGYSTGLNEWTKNFPPPMANGMLNEISLTNDKLTDLSAQRLMEWVYMSAKDTLKVLILSNNDLTRVPSKISSFEKLERLDLSYNNIHTVAAGSLAFKSPVSRLWLSNSNIHQIENGAFKGDFSKAQVYVQLNNLTKFDSAVFNTILEQMAPNAGPGVYMVANGSNLYI